MSQVAFFPYFPKDDIDQKIGRIHLFNLIKFGDQYILNPEMRKRIDEFCALYVDSEHTRLSTPTIAVIDENYRFDDLTDEQEKDLSRYSAALLFCSVIENMPNSVCVSEQFNLAIQRFALYGNSRPQHDFISFETGSFLRTHNT